MVDPAVQCSSIHARYGKQIEQHARIKIARTGTHDQAASGGEAHCGLDAAAMLDGCHARPIPKMGDDDPAISRAGILCAQSGEDGFIREAMKTVANDPCIKKPARQRIELSDARHAPMKGGIKASYLKGVRVRLLRGTNGADGLGKMIGVNGA